MSESKVESYLLDLDTIEMSCILGERIKLSDKAPPSMFGVDTLSGLEDWLAEKVREKFSRTENARAEEGIKKPGPLLSGDLGETYVFRFSDKTLARAAASLEVNPSEMILPLRRQDDGRLLAAQVAPHPTPPVTKAVTFDGYPLKHVVGYSLVEQWVEVLVFDDKGERPVWRDGKWLTQRLSGKVESIADGEKA